jgi:aminopeptidase N
MRKIPILILAALLALLTIFPQQVDIYSRPEQFERSRDYDALHYRLEFRFDREHKTYQGTNTITLKPLRDDFRECKLDSETHTVTSARDAEGNSLAFEQTGRHLFVRWTDPIPYGEEVTFEVEFEGRNGRTGVKFLDAAETHPEQINTYGWPENNHHWFPCYDFPNDKVTNEIIATVRSSDKVLSNGRLVGVSRSEREDYQTWHWSQEKPHPVYCITMTVGPYEVIEDSLGDLPVNYWVYKKDVPDALRSFQKTPRMIDFFSTVFDYPYPWAKYDQICVAGSGGGIENTSATVLGHGTIHNERADQDFSSEGLVAHELAHMWWGDMVTERTWSHVWLSESFATFAEYLWARHDKGEDEGALNLKRKKDSYLREARTRYMRPLVFNRYNRPWDIMDSHSYPKGATVLNMLRFVMDDKPFFRSLSHFLHKHAYQVVDTFELMTAIKEATGRNLDWFFEQWVFKAGHPVFDIRYTWDAGQGRVILTVKQVQDTSRGVPIHRTPVKIGITTAGGHTSSRLWIEGKEEEFVLDCAQKPLLVRFDEGNFLLKEWTFEKSREELLYQLRHDDAIGRMWAASELEGASAVPEVRTALEAAAVEDPFWSVRASAIEALLGTKDPKLVPFFRNRSLDESSRVRTSALRILGTYRDPSLCKFFRERFEKDDSYLAQAEALSALGLCRDPGQIPFLRKAGKMESPRNIIRRSADTAIKALEEKQN